METGTLKISESSGNILPVFFYEALGSGILVYSWHFMNGQIGFALLMAIVICGGAGGGHFNPAVTFAVWLREDNKGANIKAMLIMMFS